MFSISKGSLLTFVEFITIIILAFASIVIGSGIQSSLQNNNKDDNNKDNLNLNKLINKSEVVKDRYKKYINNFIKCIIDNKFDFNLVAKEKKKRIKYDITINRITESKDWDTFKIEYYDKYLLKNLEEIKDDSVIELEAMSCPSCADEINDLITYYKKIYPNSKTLELNFSIEDYVDYIDKKADEYLKKIIQKEKINIDTIKKIKEKVISLVNKHSKILLRKRKQKIIISDYGIENRNNWNNEKKFFIEDVYNNIYNDIDTLDYEYKDKILDDIVELIDITLDNLNSDTDITFNDKMSGYEYEEYCQNILNKNQWKTFKTKQSGDQGADIIASKDNLTIVVQCKKYSGNIGNKAVQEVYSAKEFYDADISLVVSNHGSYTKSAKELASKLKVKLLHHDDLNNLKKII